ncbi:hypothetical protein [Brevibacillus thermoruber]|uniref:hypothetical protein n=1 Tax=Brevibacillus thermoruber TaxID=33942 RepID=UPI00040C047E|nr:hypothetical protein [Brevibacillus thermoruber]
MFLTVTLPKFRREKYEVIKWADFFTETESVLTPRQKRKITALLASATTAYVLHLETASASSMSDMIVRAFDPIIDVVQSVSYPVCFLMIVGSFLLVMIGQKSKGIAMLKWAAIGFVGVQFAPAIMKILVGVGKAVSAGAR